MKIKKFIVPILDFITERSIFFMKLWIWPIFLSKEMSIEDGITYQRLSALFMGFGIVWPLIAVYLCLNLEVNLKGFIQIIVFGYLIIGLVAHFIFKREFGESFLPPK